MVLKIVKQWFWLIILVTTLIIFLYFGMDKYLGFDFLRQNSARLLSWVANHYLLSVITFMLIYTIIVSISFPGASYLTIIGGYLFGAYLNTLYVVVSATIGAVILFTIVRHSISPFISNKPTSFLNKMRKGFQENTVQYLFFLRILPIFPFWAVNIGAAILNVRLLTFTLVTIIGIIPGAFIYSLLGNGLQQVLDQHKEPNMRILFEPFILLPLLLLATLAILPILIKKLQRKSNN